MTAMIGFSQFARILYSVFGNGEKVDDFTRNLFLNITDFSKAKENIVEDYGLPTFKSYFNNSLGISGIAHKINKFLAPEKFALFLDSFSDAVISNLTKSLLPYIPDITEHNAAELCAYMFNDIIVEAAKPKKRKVKNAPSVKNASTASGSASLTGENKYQTRLLVESNGYCPNDNCCQPLYIDIDGNTQMDYIITVIDPNKPSDDFRNLIALCPSCGKKYALAFDEARMRRLAEIKAQLMSDSDAKESLSGIKIEEGVERVLRKISETPPDKLIPLNYDPVDLKDKILPINRALYIKTKAYVSEYYNTVHGIFQQLSNEGKLRFTPFCMQVRYNYYNLRDKGFTQPQIFSKLTEWIADNTNDSRDICEIVIAYFVQKCEVFDAIAK